MNKCISLGLRRCRACALYGSDIKAGGCWIDFYAKEIQSYSDKEIKDKFIEYKKANDYGVLDPDWFYYYSNTIVKLLPEKAHIVEKLLVLL